MVFKKLKSSSTLRIAGLALMLFVLLQGLPAAGTTSDYCSTIINSSANNTNVLGIGAGPFNTLVSTALLIMLMMVNIAALAYLLGQAFKVDRLVRFGRSELGEIAITMLIVLIFIGTFQAVVFNASAFPLPPGNFLALSPNALSPNIFTSDCLSLAGASTTVISDLVGLFTYQQTNTFFSTFSYSTTVDSFGISTVPLQGLTMQSAIFSKIVQIAIALIGVPLAITFVLAIIFSLFPIFLYLGIILRSFPWTRAAGGAFLGLFIAFYVFFPLMLYALVYYAQIPQITAVNGNYAQGLFGGLNPLTLFLPGNGVLGFSQASEFIKSIIGGEMYIFFSVIMAFIIAYDFMEALGDILGAPSLRSSDTLKRLI